MNSAPKSTLRRTQHGMSMIELMISITLGLLIVAALVTVFSNISRSRGEIERGSEQLENGRAAIEVLSEDLQLAGYFGELDVKGAPGATLPDPCSTDPAVWDSAMLIHVQGFDEGAGAPSCMPASTIASTDILTLRRVKTCIAGSTGCEAVVNGKAYLQTAMCVTATPSYVLGLAGTATFDRTALDCATVTGLRLYAVHTYFLSSDNGSGLSVPTLKRLEFDGATFTEVPLVEGIERIEYEYGIDSDANGAPNSYSAAPVTSADWNNVMTVKVHVLARALEASSGYTDTKTYKLGSVTAGPFNDGYRRHVFTNVVRLINPAGRREAP